MSAGPPKQGPPPVFLNDIFFKSHASLSLPQPPSSSAAQCVACSKTGVVLVSGGGSVLVLKAQELLSSTAKDLSLEEVESIRAENPAFGGGGGPSFISVSGGEDELLAVSGGKGGTPFVFVFRTEEFVETKGRCAPVAEIRLSAPLSFIAWNPGEGPLGNYLALLGQDGSLFLAHVKAATRSVELTSYKGSKVTCISWSPKGKQLVAGLEVGGIKQLKLDLAEAKSIPLPAVEAAVPTSIHWIATTQFLVNFVVDGRDIDLMQLDLAKGAPPSYTSLGDAFVSDRVERWSKAFFLGVPQWNVIVAPSSMINDVILLSKLEGSENWTLGDLNDNRRAALHIDNYAVGASLYTGTADSVVSFGETEIYQGMPAVFVISQNGVLSCFTLVNGKQGSGVGSKVVKLYDPRLFQKGGGQGLMTPTTVVDTVDSHGGSASVPPTFSQQPQQQQQPLFKPPASVPELKPLSTAFTAPESGMFKLPTGPATSFGFGTTALPAFTAASSSPPVSVPTALSRPVTATTVQGQVQPSKPLATNASALAGFKSITGLPSLPQVEDLKRMVEEKRSQGTFAKDDQEDEMDMDELLLQVEMFQKRLELFRRRKTEFDQKLSKGFSQGKKAYEEEVLSPINLMENFVSTLKETKQVQQKEVNEMQKKMLGNFTELEYSRALAERQNDPKYVRILKAQPMDGYRTAKFTSTEKLCLYLKKQVAQCEDALKQRSWNTQPLNSAAAMNLIYQTLQAHSKIIHRLGKTINAIRAQIGLQKSYELEGIKTFEIPAMGHNYYDKKPLIKERPMVGQHPKNSVPKVHKVRESQSKAEDDAILTVDDITAGISRFKLNKLREKCEKKSKPIRITNEKVDALQKAFSTAMNLTVPTVEKDGIDPYDLSVKNKTKSKALINKLDVSTEFPKTPKKEDSDAEVEPKTSTPIAALKGSHAPASPVLPSPFSDMKSLLLTPKPVAFTSAFGVGKDMGVGDTAATFKTPTTVPSLSGFASTIPVQQATTTPTSSSLFKSDGNIAKSGFAFAPAPTLVSTGAVENISAKPQAASKAVTSTKSEVSKALPPKPPKKEDSTVKVESTTSTPTPIVPLKSSQAPVSGADSSPFSEVKSLLLSPKPAAITSPFGFGKDIGAGDASTIFKTSTAATGFSLSSSVGSTTPFLQSTAITTSSPLFKSDAPITGFAFASPPASTGTGSTHTGTVFGKSVPITSSVTGFSLPTASSNIFGASTLSISPSSTTPATVSTSTPTTTASAPTTKTQTAAAAPFSTIKFGEPTSTTAPVSTSSTVAPSSTTPSSSPFSNLFGTSTSTPASAPSFNLFGASVTATAPTSTTPPTAPTSSIFGASSLTSASTTPAPIPTLTSTTPATAPSSSVFGSSVAATVPSSTVPASTTSSSLFGALTLTPVSSSTGPTTAPTSNIFGSLTITAPSSAAPTTAPPSSNIFGTSTFTLSSTDQSSGLFGTSTSAAAPASNIFGAAATTAAPSSNIFGASTPATAAPSSNIFGASTPATAPASNIFGASTAAPPSNIFGAASTATGSSNIFGPSAAAPSNIFGGSTPATTPSSSIFGAPATSGGIFGAASPAAAPSSNIFGAASPAAAPSSGIFGGASQTAPASNIFGAASPAAAPSSNIFGAASPAAAPSPSVFGASPTAKPAFGSSAVFGGSAAFGGGGSVFGGNPTFGGSPAFGGSASFGSGSGSSPFGSAFGSSGAPASPSGGIFGGTVATQGAPSFGALAHSTPPQGGFGGGSTFGSPAFGQQQQPSSPFGQAAPAFGSESSAQSPSFGGSAFSSWR